MADKNEKNHYDEVIKDYLKDGIKGYAKDQFFDEAQYYLIGHL